MKLTAWGQMGITEVWRDFNLQISCWENDSLSLEAVNSSKTSAITRSVEEIRGAE